MLSTQKLLLSLTCVLSFLTSILGQTNPVNLVPNPGFETYTICPTNLAQVDFASPWDNPGGIGSSSDFFHYCNYNQNPSLYSITFGPHTGNGFARILSNVTNATNGVSYNEYLQVPLSTPLTAGYVYEISLYVGLGPGTTGYGNNFGVLLTDNTVLNANFPYVFSMQNTYTPSFPQYTVTSYQNWEHYQSSYLAQGGESYLTIGNFLPNSAINVSPINNNNQPGVYLTSAYFIDDVSVVLKDSCELDIQNSLTGIQDTVYPCIGDNLILDVVSNSNNMVPIWNNSYVAPSFYTDTSGVYVAEFTQGLCSHSDTLVVEFVDAPSYQMADTSICLGDSLTFINPDTSYQAALTFSSILHSTDDTISVGFAGSYIYELSYYDCTVSSSFFVETVDLPYVELGNDMFMCLPSSLTLNANTFQVDSISWSTGSDSISAIVSDTGTYNVEVFNACGINQDEIEVLPYEVYYSINFNGDTLLCVDDELQVTITGNNINALWNDGVYNNSRLLSEGYWEVEISDYYCSETETIDIRIPLDVDLGLDTLLCDDEYLLLELQSILIDSLLWSNGSTGNSIMTDQAAAYWVNVYQEHCLIQDTLLVEKQYSPQLFFIDTSFCEGEQLYLELDTAYIYNINGFSIDSILLIQQESSYNLAASNYCGTSYASFYVEELDCTCPVYIANTFTPNGDDINGEFKPESDCDFYEYEFRVFNRWGQLVFETNDPDRGWEGYNSSGVVEEGTYIYSLSFGRDKGGEEKMTGHVNVLK